MSHTRLLHRHVVVDALEPDMTLKINIYSAAPDLMKSWTEFSEVVAGSIDPTIAELVKVRASQINGCANCLNMHTIEARAKGETEQRLYLLSAWREAPCYTDRERAALGWADALTSLSENHTHQDAYCSLAAYFTTEEQVQLTLMVNVINGWNRLATGFGLWVEPQVSRAQAQAVQ
jgi:AhpD family alkylhydroperoxidase